MAARTAFFLIVTITVMQNVKADSNITTNTDAIHNLSKLVEQWNKTVQDVVNKMKNETEKIISKGKEAFDDIRKDVEEAIKDGKCVVDNRSFTEHIKSGDTAAYLMKELSGLFENVCRMSLEDFEDMLHATERVVNPPVSSN